VSGPTRCESCGRFASAGLTRCSQCTRSPTASAGTVHNILDDWEAFRAAEDQALTDLLAWIEADMRDPAGLKAFCTD